jgi:hypothetical protein
VALPAPVVGKFQNAAEAANIEYLMFAEFGGSSVAGITSSGKKVDVPLATLRAAHEGWLPAYMKGGNA